MTTKGGVAFAEVMTQVVFRTQRLYPWPPYEQGDDDRCGNLKDNTIIPAFGLLTEIIDKRLG